MSEIRINRQGESHLVEWTDPSQYQVSQPGLDPGDIDVMGAGFKLAGSAAQGADRRIQQTDTAQDVAAATREIAKLYAFGLAPMVAGLVGLAWLFSWLGAGWAQYVAALLAGLGALFVLAVIHAHRVGLENSAGGIERLQVTESNHTARYAIDRTFTALERKWGVRHDLDD